MLLVLQSAGADVMVVASAQDALDSLQGFQPHVLVSDIAMPEMDGYELLRRIAAVDGSRPAPPVIALTAYVSEQDSRRALAAGFARHLGKPVSHDVLIRMVAELVSDATTAAE
jgi:CheY-like chemotaxis protein